MYSKNTVKKYLQLVEKIEDKRKELYSVVELCEILEVSRPTMTAFLKGELIRFDILEQVGALVGYDFWFDLVKK
jgi:predicted XRE-type DNA-binding protein